MLGVACLSLHFEHTLSISAALLSLQVLPVPAGLWAVALEPVQSSEKFLLKKKNWTGSKSMEQGSLAGSKRPREGDAALPDYYVSTKSDGAKCVRVLRVMRNEL